MCLAALSQGLGIGRTSELHNMAAGSLHVARGPVTSLFGRFRRPLYPPKERKKRYDQRSHRRSTQASRVSETRSSRAEPAHDVAEENDHAGRECSTRRRSNRAKCRARVPPPSSPRPASRARWSASGTRRSASGTRCSSSSWPGWPFALCPGRSCRSLTSRWSSWFPSRRSRCSG